MKTTLAVLLFGLAMPGTALAGGPATPDLEPAPAAPAHAAKPSQDWTGFYVGIQGTRYSGSASVIATGREAFTFSGTLGGLHAGYDHDFGSFVPGGEIAAETGSIGYDLSSNGRPAPFSLDRMVSLRVKAGFDLGRVLVYGTLGTARASIGDTSGLPASDPESADGTLYGLGVSALLSDRVVGGVELLDMDFDPYKGATTLDSEATAVSLRLSYRF